MLQQAESQAAAESQTKEFETVFVLNLVPLSSPLSPTSLSPPTSSTCTTILPSLSSKLPLPCSKCLQQMKRTNTSASSHYSPSVSLPSPSAFYISTSLCQEGPRVKNRRKGNFLHGTSYSTLLINLLPVRVDFM